MLLKGKNNAHGVLYELLQGIDSTCKIAAGHTFTGIETPFNMTIYDLDLNNEPTNYEIVTVTNIVIDTLYDTFSITRAQEGTSAMGHDAGKRCANLITYGIIDGINDKLTAIDNTINIIEVDIGDVDILTTTSKIVVGAINELDSEYLVTDSVTGTVYRWNIAIADGVPSINFTEVI